MGARSRVGRELLRLGLCGVLAAGCGGAGPRTGRRISPLQQHEVGARTEAKAERVAARADGDRAAPGTPSGERAMDRAMGAYRRMLRNAATRDREMEGLIRRYLILTRAVFQHFRLNRPRPGDPASYDPLPAWRFQGQQSFEYRLLAARAGMLERTLGEFARARHLDPDAVPRARDRQGRVALYRRIFACIRRDALARAKHGRRYLARVGKGARLAPRERVGIYQGELAMLRWSVRCTTLTSMRRPEMAFGGASGSH